MRDLIVLHEPGESSFGKRPEDRSVPELLKAGVINLDKPQGPTSHQVSAWVRDLLGLQKAGHAGTLDPRVSGVLPVALESATRALEAMLVGDKEYVGVLQVHQDVDEARVRAMMSEFVGEIYQTPPVRSAVKRELRTRTIHELEPIEHDGRLTLFRARCESGTYIRTLCNDIGDALGTGAHLADLRRTRTASFQEKESVSLNALKDAFVLWKEEGEESAIRGIVKPLERMLVHLPAIVVKDTAVDALCHGASLAMPGVAKLDRGIRKGDLLAIYSAKGEGVALMDAAVDANAIVDLKSGIAATSRRVLMEPGTYPKLWKRD